MKTYIQDVPEVRRHSWIRKLLYLSSSLLSELKLKQYYPHLLHAIIMMIWTEKFSFVNGLLENGKTMTLTLIFGLWDEGRLNIRKLFRPYTSRYFFWSVVKNLMPKGHVRLMNWNVTSYKHVQIFQCIFFGQKCAYQFVIDLPFVLKGYAIWALHVNYVLQS